MEGLVSLLWYGGGALFQAANTTVTNTTNNHKINNSNSHTNPVSLNLSKSLTDSNPSSATSSGSNSPRNATVSIVKDKGIDKDGNKYINQYLFIKTISRGSFSKARLVLSTVDNQYYCVKEIKTRNFFKAAHSLVGRLRSFCK